jgi:hypothetical protein
MQRNVTRMATCDSGASSPSEGNTCSPVSTSQHSLAYVSVCCRRLRRQLAL